MKVRATILAGAMLAASSPASVLAAQTNYRPSKIIGPNRPPTSPVTSDRTEVAEILAVVRARKTREARIRHLRRVAAARHRARLAAIAASRRRAAAAARQAADALTASSTAWARSPEAVHVYMCESGDNIHAVNGQYLGKWQMDPSFWSTYGGLQFASTPLGATEAEQDYVAWRGWKARGWSPWQCAA